VSTPEDSTDPTERDYVVLTRMLSDAEQLCRTDDPFMLGQYRHLHGRVAALVDMMRPANSAGIVP
jgi:hypothetical protein